jgi:glycosyltransferase involved in cell wall biosynthesis
MDSMIVPTETHKQQVKDIGFTGEIYKLNYGVNPDMYKLGINPLIKTNKFTFLMVAVAQERKRWREVIAGYLETFNKERVSLILRLVPTGTASISVIENHIKEERKRTGSVAEIIMRATPIPVNLSGLYSSANCIISLGAEGWDLPLMEAIACGCSGIAIDWLAHTEWFTEDMGYKVKVKELQKVTGMTGFSGYQDEKLKWAYPDLEDYKKQLRLAYENQSETKQKGINGSKTIRENYSWDKTVGKFIFDFNRSKTLGLDTPTYIPKKPKLSVAMITRNVGNFDIGGKNVFASNLKILSNLADEIVIIDAKSTDSTLITAAKYGAKVYQYEEVKQECGYCGGVQNENTCKQSERATKECFAKFRKASFKMCSGEWIFRIDADELIREEDVDFLKTIISNSYNKFYNIFAFGFPTMNFFGKMPYYKCGWDGNFSWYPDFHTRLYRNIPECKEWFSPAHEGVCVATPQGWTNIIGHNQTLLLPEPIVYHYGYLKKDSGDRNTRYKELGAKTHDLSFSNYYCCGILKYEGVTPKIEEVCK